MELKTKRLVLRELRESDAKDITENANNKEVSKYLVAMPYPYSLEDAKKFILDCSKEAKKEPREGYDFGITLKGEGKVIGMISLERINMFHETGTIGYWLGERHHRNGYMTEALERVLEFSFNEIMLRKINIAAFAENVASNKLINKVKFMPEGLRKEHIKDRATGKVHDENIYGMLRRDYVKRK